MSGRIGDRGAKRSTARLVVTSSLLVQEAAGILRKNLRGSMAEEGWPSSNNDDVAEANVTHALATAGSRRGFSPVFEVSLGRGKGRVDLVLVDKRRRQLIVVEVKLLYPVKQCALQCKSDMARMASRGVVEQLGLEGFKDDFEQVQLFVGSLWIARPSQELRRRLLGLFQQNEDRSLEVPEEWRCLHAIPGAARCCRLVQKVQGSNGRAEEHHLVGIAW